MKKIIYIIAVATVGCTSQHPVLRYPPDPELFKASTVWAHATFSEHAGDFRKANYYYSQMLKMNNNKFAPFAYSGLIKTYLNLMRFDSAFTTRSQAVSDGFGHAIELFEKSDDFKYRPVDSLNMYIPWPPPPKWNYSTFLIHHDLYYIPTSWDSLWFYPILPDSVQFEGSVILHLYFDEKGQIFRIGLENNVELLAAATACYAVTSANWRPYDNSLKNRAVSFSIILRYIKKK